MRPDFSKISYKDIKGSNPVLKHKSDKQQSWIAPEKIKVKPVYSIADLQDMSHMDYASGIPPFLERPVFDHVCDAALDGQAICRIFNR
jgi:methylmalonyl-CoA mutase